MLDHGEKIHTLTRIIYDGTVILFICVVTVVLEGRICHKVAYTTLLYQEDGMQIIFYYLYCIILYGNILFVSTIKAETNGEIVIRANWYVA